MTVTVKYDGLLYAGLTVSSLEIFHADSSTSIVQPVPAVGGFVSTRLPVELPVGVRQTVMARLVVLPPNLAATFPDGPYSPWTYAHFIIPKIANVHFVNGCR